MGVMTTAGIIGAVVGLIMGIVDFFILRSTVANREMTQQSRTIFTLVSYVSLFIFPVVGWYAGVTLFGGQ